MKKEKKNYHHFTYTERLQIEAWVKAKVPVSKMAKLLGKTRTSVYRELKRGECELRASDWKMYTSYSATIAEDKYQLNLRAKGAGLKIGKDFEYAKYLEDKILKEKYSPRAVLAEIKEKGLTFQTSICETTLYRYIDIGVFAELTNDNLPVKKKKKRKRKNKIIRAAKAPAGNSIEKRDKEIETRNESGHWEMDCVIGKKDGGAALLVLTERATRREIIRVLPQKTAANVVATLDRLEKKIGKKLFAKIFQTITVDNGSEFADAKGIERSVFSGKRTTVYYCHPYSSCERGSNENQNKLIRRWHPKGSCFNTVRNKDIRALENWINNYPRKIFDGKSSEQICRADPLMKLIC